MKKRLSLCIRFWGFCNNSCDFCFEQKESFKKLNTDYWSPSIAALDENMSVVNKLVNQDNYEYWTFKLMGGELFATNDIDIQRKLAEVIKTLRSQYNHIEKQILDDPCSPETIVLASNLLNPNANGLKMALDELKAKSPIKSTVMASYDLNGRFHNDYSLETYMKNIQMIRHEYGSHVTPVVSMTMTKQNINELLTQDTAKKTINYFNYLYDNGFAFDLSLLLNDCNVHKFAYSKSELDDFIDLLVNRYPRLLNTFKDTKKYHAYRTNRLTIQCGEILNEHNLHNESNDLNCLICSQYKKCHHSYGNISYNAYDCDVKEILNHA